MKTDDLIEALAAGLTPERPARPDPLLLALALAVATGAVLVLFGVRSDLATALLSPVPWLKLGYMAALTTAALWLATRLGRPGADVRPALAALLGVLAIAVGWAGVELALTPAGLRTTHWLGHTWTICGRNILMVAALAATPVFLSARGLAPVRPSAAGAALGVVAGGMAAAAYGLLFCTEATAAAVVTWYTLGVAAAGAIGAVVGRFALRW